ncbi:MAG: antirestriction protein ArdA [Sneathiella sp.]|nr:antirestriction protein ArdA [Sneathiella sp.]
MENQEGEIRIYVACLAAYNNGILHGAWIDAAQDAYGIWDAVHEMLAASPIENAQEFAIHDYEGFEGVSIREYQGFDSVAEIAAFIVKHGALGGKLIEYYGSLEDAEAAISDHYVGEYESLTDFAREVTEETGEVPRNLAYYINYERMARDLEVNDVLAIETGFKCVHVFWRA